MTQLETYTHSGRLGPGALVVPLVAALAAVLLGIAYGYADVYCPVAGYVSAVLVFLCALGVGYAISQAALLSKCRNQAFVTIFGCLAGLLTLYSSWGAFIFALVQRYAKRPLAFDLADVFTSPRGIWEIARQLNKEGWYSIFGGTPSGITLWLFWAIEAGVLIIVTPVVSRIALSRRVFCEHSGQWCRVLRNHFRVGISDQEESLRRTVEGDLDALGAQPAVCKSAAPALQVDLHHADDPFGTSALQLKLVRLRQEKDGTVKEETEALTPLFLLSPEQYQRVKALAERAPVTPEIPEDEVPSSPEGVDADTEAPG